MLCLALVGFFNAYRTPQLCYGEKLDGNVVVPQYNCGVWKRIIRL